MLGPALEELGPGVGDGARIGDGGFHSSRMTRASSMLLLLWMSDVEVLSTFSSWLLHWAMLVPGMERSRGPFSASCCS